MDPGPIRDGLTVVVGAATGMLSAAFGVGGAVLSTPGIRLLGAPALVAVGTTLPSILPGAATGTLRYLREGLVDLRVVALVAPIGAVTAVVASLASAVVPGDGRWLMVLTAVLVGITALRIARGEAGTARRPDARSITSRPSAAAAAALGAGAGALSGLLGVGGGMVLIPGFVTLLRLPLKTTVATSLACVGLLAIPATVTHALLGHIDWRFALLLAAGVVPGARVGAGATVRAGERQLRLALSAVLGVIAAAYLVSELVAIFN